jgi:hypothetical protein
MNISGTCGNKVVNSSDELTDILRNSRKEGFGEFQISEKRYPAMLIHINGSLAYLHFFTADKHPGFQAIGDITAHEEVTFRQEGHGDFSMPRAVVVTADKAYQAAAEFFASRRLPGCAEWMEL